MSVFTLRYAWSFKCWACGEPIQPLADYQKQIRQVWKIGDPEPGAVEVVKTESKPVRYTHIECTGDVTEGLQVIKDLAVLPVNEEADELVDTLISERIPKDQTSTLLESTMTELTTFMNALPEPFPSLFKGDPKCDWLPLLMGDEGSSLSTSGDTMGDITKIVRVEIWVGDSDQYVYTDRLKGSDWNPPMTGEHPYDQVRVNTLEDVAACTLKTVHRPGWEPQIHPAIKAMVILRPPTREEVREAVTAVTINGTCRILLHPLMLTPVVNTDGRDIQLVEVWSKVMEEMVNDNDTIIKIRSINCPSCSAQLKGTMMCKTCNKVGKEQVRWYPRDDFMKDSQEPERLTLLWSKAANVLVHHAEGLTMRTGHNDVNSIVEEIKGLLEAESKKG